MARAALVQFPGDPFRTMYWMELFRNIWRKEVDVLYVALNMPPWVPDEILQANLAAIGQSHKIKLLPQFPAHYYYQHGDTMKELLLASTEDHVVFIEDDGFIFRPAIVDRCFKMLENGFQLVGSPRGSCSKPIYEKSNELYGLEHNFKFYLAPNWWPNFFFCNRDVLLKTDLDFNARTWEPGAPIGPLGVISNELMLGDTFVWASIQIRSQRPKEAFVEQYHSYPHDLKLFRKRTHLWDGKCQWLHVGSLSGTMSDKDSYFNSEEDIVRSTNSIIETSFHYNNTRFEFLRRLSWVKMIYEETTSIVSLPQETKDRYYQNLLTQMKTMQLPQNQVNALIGAYKHLLPTVRKAR